MCGIAGLISDRNSGERLEALLLDMTNLLKHRGPDDWGTWVHGFKGVAFGHRRLSIIDLSERGRQPMRSACGRYVVVYNGEVYNYKALRAELEPFGHVFSGHSDTEVILAAIAQWGLDSAVCRFVGMFAFALWDESLETLSLVRDRLGIKPLYYGRAGSDFVFGSELKVFREHPGFDASVDRDSLSLFFRHNYIPAPYSIYKDVYKLEPGHILTLGLRGGEPSVKAYWSAREVWLHGEANPFSGNRNEAATELERLLLDSVGMRMLSDVPLGAFLSGGVDSSTIVALMQAQSSIPVKSFSIGFGEEEYNEAKHAKAVAAHLGTDHTELYLEPSQLLDVVPHIPHFWDEPFSDSSQVPTYCVSQLARSKVKVSLSGDGGDELFAGYQRYFWMDKWNILERIPLFFRKFFKGVMGMTPAAVYSMFGNKGPKVRTRLGLLSMQSFREFYLYFLSHQRQPGEFVLGSQEPVTQLTNDGNNVFADNIRQMTFWDTVSYLPDDILTKVDRASMAVSLEARVPLLDHRVVEFAASLPMAMKTDGRTGKFVLRDVLYKYVPRELIDRPKAGFAVPIDKWMRKELRDWCESLLDPVTIRSQGYLNHVEVGRLWDEHVTGKADWHYYLWDILMFQAWLEKVGNEDLSS